MPLTNTKTQRYLGGGRLYYEEGAGNWLEIGSVKDFKYNIETETKEAMKHDGCMEELADIAVTSIKGKISFSTENINAKNFAMSSMGEEEDKTYAAGDELPDGTTATGTIVVKMIKAGKKLLDKKRIKFVGAKCTNKQQFVVEFPSVILTPTGDKSLQATDWMKLDFSGDILKKEDEDFYTEYVIPAA